MATRDEWREAIKKGDIEGIKSFGRIPSYAAYYAGVYGQLEIFKWIRANGGEWTHRAANWAAENGHLETLKWIRGNGGEWTHWAADCAAMNGHLETLKWIRANGGGWTLWAADTAAMNGHLETLKWIRANGGECTYRAADYAAKYGHLATLKWLKANGAPISTNCPEGLSMEVLDYSQRVGIEWGNMDQVMIELDSLYQTQICDDLKVLIGNYVSKK